MAYFQYIEDLYQSSDMDVWMIRDVSKWLCSNVGAQGDARINDVEDWAWALSNIYNKRSPCGIYFARPEDQLAFRIKFNIGRGRTEE